MDLSAQKQQIAAFVEDFIKESPEVFLVEVNITLGNNISVFIDADNGLKIATCTRVNKALYNYIEENALFGDKDFAIEVSSPGVEEPLKLLRQYQHNIGRLVEVTLDDESKAEGKLLSANNEEISIEQKEGKGKKETIKNTVIPFNKIKHTIVLVTF